MTIKEFVKDSVKMAVNGLVLCYVIIPAAVGKAIGDTIVEIVEK